MVIDLFLQDGKVVGSDGPAPEGAKTGTLIERAAYERIIASLEERSTIWGRR